MKVALLDFWFGETHKRLNQSYIRLLSKFSEVYLINYSGYYDEFSACSNIKLINVNINNKNRNKVMNRINYAKNILRTHNSLKRYYKDIDYIFITGYECITITIYPYLFPRNIPAYLFHHQHLDQINHGIKGILFKIYQDKFKHIVLEKIFRNYLTNKLKVNEKDVFVLHHTLLSKSVIKEKNNKVNLLLGISSNNDENIIKQIIDDEIYNKTLERHNYKMILRSHKYEYESFSLIVYNKFLSVEEYESLYSNADAILVLVVNDFHYRVSGTIFDAVSQEKYILGVKIPIIKMYEKLYPSVFKSFSSYEDLKSILIKNDFNMLDKEVKNLKNRHADERITDELKQIFR